MGSEGGWQVHGGDWWVCSERRVVKPRVWGLKGLKTAGDGCRERGGKALFWGWGEPLCQANLFLAQSIQDTSSDELN